MRDKIQLDYFYRHSGVGRNPVKKTSPAQQDYIMPLSASLDVRLGWIPACAGMTD